jgi:hypothetical protein
MIVWCQFFASDDQNARYEWDHHHPIATNPISKILTKGINPPHSDANLPHLTTAEGSLKKPGKLFRQIGPAQFYDNATLAHQMLQASAVHHMTASTVSENGAHIQVRRKMDPLYAAWTAIAYATEPLRHLTA